MPCVRAAASTTSDSDQDPMITPATTLDVDDLDLYDEQDQDEDNDVDQDGQPVMKPEDIQLWLPSQLSQRYQSLPSMAEAVRLESRLREAQAYDALGDIRRLRRVIMGVSEFRRANVSGTGNKANTRTRTLYTSFQDKIKVCAARYRAAYRALKSTDPDGSWTNVLRPLAREDIRGPGKDDDALGEGRFEMSWIWLVPGVQTGETTCDTQSEEFVSSMRVQWFRSRARAERWEEEKIILQEEMRRVLEFFEWKQSWWLKQVQRRDDATPLVQRGLTAYAHKQSEMYGRLVDKFFARWNSVFDACSLRPEWRSRYLVDPMEDVQEYSDANRTQGSGSSSTGIPIAGRSQGITRTLVPTLGERPLYPSLHARPEDVLSSDSGEESGADIMQCSD